MLCPDCQTYAAEEDIVCPRCGKLLNRQASEEEELMSFRQGRHLRRAESELPPPPAEPGSTGASRSFEDVHPRQSAEATGAMYSRREQLASTGKFYGLQDGALDEAPISYEAGGSATIMAIRQSTISSSRFISRCQELSPLLLTSSRGVSNRQIFVAPRRTMSVSLGVT